MNKDKYVGIYEYQESDSFRPTIDKRIHIDSSLSKTICARDDQYGIIERERESNCSLRIRKLTPKECMRLMGFEDEDYQALVDAGQSSSQIYHEAGDSIVVSVLAMIFGQMLPIDEKDLIKVVENYNRSLAEKKED